MSRNKDIGSAYERAAAEYLNTVCGERWQWRRRLGEGRKEDIGDLVNKVDPSIVVQVKYRSDFAKAVRMAADGAAVQVVHAEGTYHFGMVKIPNARKAPVWLAATYDWPVPLDVYADTPTVGSPRKAVDALRAGSPVVTVRRAGTEDLVVGSVEEWFRVWSAMSDVA